MQSSVVDGSSNREQYVRTIGLRLACRLTLDQIGAAASITSDGGCRCLVAASPDIASHGAQEQMRTRDRVWRGGFDLRRLSREEFDQQRTDPRPEREPLAPRVKGTTPPCSRCEPVPRGARPPG